MLVDDIAQVLEVRPGLTADELHVVLSGEASGRRAQRDSSAVTLALFQAPERFVADGEDPPRWRLARGPTGESRPVARVALPATAALPTLFDWQIEALDSWRAAGSRGVVEAVTGAGKTVLGLSAAAAELAARGQVLVIVPTIELMCHWEIRLRECLPPSYSVGCAGGGATADLVAHDVVVGVVNSLRWSDANPIRPGGLLVADECHRYGSALNRLALDERFQNRLGLSATYAREDGGHLAWLEPYFGGTVYRLGYARAVRDGVTARFRVALLGVPLSAEERDSYEALTESLGVRAARLMRYGLDAGSGLDFLRQVIVLAGGRGAMSAVPRRAGGAAAEEADEGVGEARAYLRVVRERRALVAGAAGKVELVKELAPALASADRSIVFTHTIESAEAMAAGIRGAGMACTAVHSAMHQKDRRAALEAFAGGRVRSVVAPHVLDEGVDVPAADLAVIVTASRSRRQMIQRLGRVLRPKPDGRRARLAVIFAEATIEDPAHGAHETFLDEILPVADEVRRFDRMASGSCGEAGWFLSSP